MEVINAGKQGELLIVKVKGRLDAGSAPDFEQRLKQWIKDGDTGIALDFAELDYISSAGLRAVLSTAKMLKAKNGRFAVASLKGPVKEVFEISGFTSILPVYDSIESALSAT